MAGSSHLKPGDRGTIRASLDTRSRIGEIVRTIQVFTNDPKRPRVILTVKADI
jgi:hypothetical protein